MIKDRPCWVGDGLCSRARVSVQHKVYDSGRASIACRSSRLSGAKDVDVGTAGLALFKSCKRRGAAMGQKKSDGCSEDFVHCRFVSIECFGDVLGLLAGMLFSAMGSSRLIE